MFQNYFDSMDEYVEDRSDEGPIKGEIQICIEQIEKTFES